MSTTTICKIEETIDGAENVPHNRGLAGTGVTGKMGKVC